MLKENYLNSDYKDRDLNCSETVLTVASESLGMNLGDDALRLSSAFGGGMCIEEKCGAVTGALMVLGYFFVKEKAHESDVIKTITREYFKRYEMLMGSCECKPLKDMHRTDEYGCREVIAAALLILDEMLDEYAHLKVR